jgi:hypothetical protein
MSWSELRILKDDRDRDNLRKQTSDSLPLETTSAIIENDSSKRSVEKQYRRNLLGKLATDLDYLESLISSVKIFDGENYSHRSIQSIRNRSMGTFDVSRKKEQRNLKNYGVGVKREAQDAILFLKRRQDFWSQLRPSYCNNP